MTRFTLVLAMAGLVAVIATAPVHAQQDRSNIVYEVQELLEEVRALRGQVESQQHEIENLRRRQRDQYLDLDRRLQALERGESGSGSNGRPASSPAATNESESVAPASAEPEAPASSGVQGDVPEVRAPIDARAEVTPLARLSGGDSRDLDSVGEEEKAAYESAFRALRETRYADAAEGFSQFLDNYPDSSYAPNALYWLAETYYVTRDFETALDYFNELLDRYPESSKRGDALLKIGFSHYEMKRWNEARAALEQVRSQHPGTTLARLAEGRLRDMRLAGHY